LQFALNPFAASTAVAVAAATAAAAAIAATDSTRPHARYLPYLAL